MGDATHLDQGTGVGFFNDRDMFFFGRIHGVFSEKLHGFPAANQFASAPMNDLYDISAGITLVYLQLIRHLFFLLIYY
jgi:hypothetical protein